MHAGGALEAELEREARREMAENARYRWLGEVPRWRARRLMAGSLALALTSRMEGGANVIGEAVTAGVPVLSTRIPGSVGLLGRDYAGYFPVGDAPALAALLRRVEVDGTYLAALEQSVRSVAPLFDPRREQAAWRALLTEF